MIHVERGDPGGRPSLVPGRSGASSTTRNLLKVRDLTLTIVTNRPLHAVLVERAGPRLLELLAAALDGSGPAIAPVDAALPPARLAEQLAALAPDRWRIRTG